MRVNPNLKKLKPANFLTIKPQADTKEKIRHTRPRFNQYQHSHNSPHLHKLKSINSIEEILDFVVALPESHIDRAISKLHQEFPTATQSQLMDTVSKRYVNLAAATSAGVGGSSAIPVHGLTIGAVLSVGEIATFAANTSIYVLTMARLAGIPTSNKQLRRSLVLSALLGEDGAKIMADQLGISLWNWAKTRTHTDSTVKLTTVNKTLINYVNKKIAKRLPGHIAGRLIPLGIGAAIGFFSGKKISMQVVSSIRTQLDT